MRLLPSRRARGVAPVLALIGALALGAVLPACSDDPTDPDPGTCGSGVVEGSIRLESQADVERLRGVVRVVGALVIGPSADITDLRPLSSLRRAKTLMVRGNTALVSLAGLDSVALDPYESLLLQDNPLLEDLRGLPPRLDAPARVTVRDAGNLASLEGMPMLSRGSYVRIERCPALVDLTGLGDQPGLSRLELSDLEGLAGLAGLAGLRALEILELNRLPALSPGEALIPVVGLRVGVRECAWRDLRPLGNIAGAERLEIWSCPSLVSLAHVGSMSALEIVSIRGCDSLATLTTLGDVPHLGSLGLYQLPSLTGFTALPDMPSLRSLVVSRCDGLTSLAGLSGNPELAFLSIGPCAGLRSLAGAQRLDGLHRLALDDCPGLTDLSGLPDLPNLQELWVERLAVPDLGGLPELPLLSVLRVVGNGNLAVLSGLPDLPLLARLSVTDNGQLSDLGDLPGMPALTDLDISWNPVLRNCAGLQGVTSLQKLRIMGNDGLASLAGLEELVAVNSELYLYDNAALTEVSALAGVQSVTGFVTIGDNPLLDTCTVLDLVKPWAATARVTIAGNGPCADGPAR